MRPAIRHIGLLTYGLSLRILRLYSHSLMKIFRGASRPAPAGERRSNIVSPATVLFQISGYTITPVAAGSLFAAAAILGAATWVALVESETTVAGRFALLGLVLAQWLFCFAALYAAPDRGAARSWALAGYVAVPLIPAALYRFTTSVLSLDRRPFRRALLWGGGLVLAAMAVSTDRIVAGLERHPWGWYPELASGGIPVAAFVLAGLILSLHAFWRAYRRAEASRERRRAAWMCVGLAVGSLASVDFLVGFGVLTGLPPVGFLSIVVLAGVTVRVVGRYGLAEFSPSFASEQVLDTMADPVVVADRKGKIRVANEAVGRILGYHREELVGRPLRRLFPERGGQAGPIPEELPPSDDVRRDLRLRARDGSAVEASVAASPVRDPEGRDVGTVLVARDIRARKALERELRHQALHDSLTGLPNRQALRHRLARCLEGAPTRAKGASGLLYVDMDRFKTVNDSLGYLAGDQVLRAAASRLEDAVPEGATAARLAGDEFAVLLPALGGPAPEVEARQTARRIVGELEAPYHLGGEEVSLGVTVGIALSEPGLTAERLLQRADLAMNHVKGSTGPSVHLFEPELEERADSRFLLESDLRRALDREEFTLEYQPLVDLEAGGLRGVEALVRWDHPEHGRISPTRFVPVAEETGHVVGVGRWVLREACRQAVRWRSRREDFESARLMVNVSAPELVTPDFVARVRRTLDETGLPGDGLALEITERALVTDPARASRAVDSLRQLGVRVLIDDFGSGYSSLGYLQRYEPDGLKVDRRFVHRIARDRRNRELVRMILDLASEFELGVVAEGVELGADARALRELGVSVAQGFYWSRPAPPHELRVDDRGRVARRAD